MLVAVGNGPSYGGGMRVCPDAVLDDGLLDVLVLHEICDPGVPAGLPQGLHRHARQPPGGQMLRGTAVRLEATGIVAYADGERFAPAAASTVEVVPGALHRARARADVA